MKVFRFFLAQCVVWGITWGAGDPPPLPSYHFGITGEPTKVDTAFGNLGEVGPVYSLPEARNDSAVSSSGKPIEVENGSTDGPIKQSTEPPKIVNATTSASTGKLNHSNSVVDITTAKSTDREEITLPDSPNGTTEKGVESSTVPNPITQTFGTSTVPNEQPASTITVPPATEQATERPDGLATPSTSSSSFTNPTNTSSSEEAHGSTTQTTLGGSPSQSFHTGSPTSPTDSPMKPHRPGQNETKPGQNSTFPAKPNSSVPVYSNNGNAWLALVGISFYAINKL